MKHIGVSEKDFACHRLMYRTNDSCQNCTHDNVTEQECAEKPDHYPTIMKSTRLMQQYCVELGARIEDHRLSWFEHNQTKCRIGNYSIVMDALNEYDKKEDNANVGTIVV